VATGQVGRDDDVGVLARVSVQGVSDWPIGRVRLSTLRLYLKLKFGRCPEVHRLLDRALVRARQEWLAERAGAEVRTAA
jgi:hypothetical protein